MDIPEPLGLVLSKATWDMSKARRALDELSSLTLPTVNMDAQQLKTHSNSILTEWSDHLHSLKKNKQNPKK